MSQSIDLQSFKQPEILNAMKSSTEHSALEPSQKLMNQSDKKSNLSNEIEDEIEDEINEEFEEEELESEPLSEKDECSEKE